MVVCRRQHHCHRLTARRMAQHQRGGTIQRRRPAVNDVDWALRVGMLEVQRVRNELVLNRQDAHRRFQRPRPGAQKSEVALRGRHRHVAEHGANGLGLKAVVFDGAGAVGDDAAQFGGRQTGVVQGSRQGPVNGAVSGAAVAAPLEGCRLPGSKTAAQPRRRAKIGAPRAEA